MANEWTPLLIHAQLVVVGPIPIRHSSAVTGTKRASLTNPIGFMTFSFETNEACLFHNCQKHMQRSFDGDAGD